MKYESAIAGTPHCKPDFSKIKVEDIVSLCPEPENAYDSNAIRVQTKEGMKLGYVKKTDTQLVRELNLSTLRITDINPSRKWSEIAVEGVEEPA